MNPSPQSQSRSHNVPSTPEFGITLRGGPLPSLESNRISSSASILPCHVRFFDAVKIPFDRELYSLFFVFPLCDKQHTLAVTVTVYFPNLFFVRGSLYLEEEVLPLSSEKSTFGPRLQLIQTIMLTSLFSAGSMTISDYESPGKEIHMLSSVLAGMFMCRTVYKLTGVVSPLLFNGYTKLNDAEKIEWNNRGFSTFHALVVAVASLYLLLFSDLFDEGSRAESIIHRRCTLSDTILGISLGYFLSDLAMIFGQYPALGGLEFVLHHGLSLFSIFLCLVSGQAQVYILMILFTECTTPFINLRWYLDVAGRKNSKLYTFNGVALFVVWLVARIFLFIFFFYHMLTHFDQVKQLFPLGFYSLLTVPPLLAAMNLFWFWKIAKGLVKTLSKARHRQ